MGEKVNYDLGNVCVLEKPSYRGRDEGKGGCCAECLGRGEASGSLITKFFKCATSCAVYRGAAQEAHPLTQHVAVTTHQVPILTLCVGASPLVRPWLQLGQVQQRHGSRGHAGLAFYLQNAGNNGLQAQCTLPVLLVVARLHPFPFYPGKLGFCDVATTSFCCSLQ